MCMRMMGQRGSNRRDTSNKGSQACAHMLHQVPNACHYPDTRSWVLGTIRTLRRTAGFAVRCGTDEAVPTGCTSGTIFSSLRPEH